MTTTPETMVDGQDNNPANAAGAPDDEKRSSVSRDLWAPEAGDTEYSSEVWSPPPPQAWASPPPPPAAAEESPASAWAPAPPMPTADVSEPEPPAESDQASYGADEPLVSVPEAWGPPPVVPVTDDDVDGTAQSEASSTQAAAGWTRSTLETPVVEPAALPEEPEVVEFFAEAAPDSDLEPEPVAGAEPVVEAEPFVAAEPELAPRLEPEPAEIPEAQAVPEPYPAPEAVVAEAYPYPVTEPEPYPVAEAEPYPTSAADTAAEPEPYPATAAEPYPGPEPVVAAEPEPVVVPEALSPVVAAEPEMPVRTWREVGYDTVARAVGTPRQHQPYQELGLQEDEYERIRQVLGRRPTESELAMYSIMWSEHCSYKSSKVHLRQFAEKAPPSRRMLAGIGENAGVVQVSDRLAVTFKVESHNHPSFVEPYQGAATGVGGIVRDILAMGARPVGVMDPLRFGAADHADTRRVLPGIVAGIGGYGNCLGLPNIGGEVVFDECYQGNPLVNALCVGVLPVNRLQSMKASGPGNVVVLIGAKTGRDGIGGVSVLASATFDAESQQRRPSVQVGDPFMEKLLIEACLEIYDAGLVVGIQDLGGAGLTCALSETAAAAGTGMVVNLDLVPLREPSMQAHEVLASESQERMLLIVTPENLPVVLSICARWGVLATAIGEVTAPPADGSGGRLVVWWRREVVVDVPPGSLADEGPVYARPMREPNDRVLLAADKAETLPRPTSADELRATLLRLTASPNLCDKTWVTEQYDRYVLGNTVLAQPEDAGVLRIDEVSGLGVALSVDGNGRFARLDPYTGAKLALAEAYRNVAVTGATPIAVTNCMNFGSPEDPIVMWQFAEAVRGLADGCQELGIPVTGGNVSFYNQTGTVAIHPTPVVGVLGVLDNVANRLPMGFVEAGDLLFQLGETREELSGSEWAHVVHSHLGGLPPAVDLAAEKALGELVAAAVAAGLLRSAHDLSDGGLAQALVESCLRRGYGAEITLPSDELDPFVHLFSESAGRALVAAKPDQAAALAELAAKHGVACTTIGVVADPETALAVEDLFVIPLDELRTAHTATLPALFS